MDIKSTNPADVLTIPWLLEVTALEWFQFSALTLCSVFFYFIIIGPLSKSLRWKLPPGPLPIPALGNLGLLAGKDPPYRALAKLAYSQYGGLMSIWMGTKLSLVVSSPETAREVLREFDAACSSRHMTYSVSVTTGGGRAIKFSPQGEYHRKMRKFGTMNLFTPRRLDLLRYIRHEEIVQMVTAVSAAAAQSPIELRSHLLRASMNNVMRLTTGKAFPTHNPDGTVYAEGKEFMANLKVTIENLAAANLSDYVPGLWMLDFSGFRSRCQAMDRKHQAFFTNQVEHNRGSPALASGDTSAMNFCELMLALQKEEGFEDADISYSLQEMVIAGSNTSSVTAEWALAELLRHPAKLERLQSELDTCFNPEGGPRTPLTKKILDQSAAKLDDLPFLQAVIAETFRLHTLNPLLIPHLTTETVNLGQGKYSIPPGTIIMINAWAISHDPATWPNPHEFQPERFDEKRADVKGTDFRLLPFGSGKRGCPGMNLGLAMVTLSVAAIVYSFELSPWEKGVDLREKFGLSVEPVTALEAVVRPRV